MTEKTREAKARRNLKKLGFALKKSRARNWYDTKQQGYMIVRTDTNSIEAGQCFDLSLEDVEKFIAE